MVKRVRRQRAAVGSRLDGQRELFGDRSGDEYAQEAGSPATSTATTDAECVRLHIDTWPYDISPRSTASSAACTSTTSASRAHEVLRTGPAAYVRDTIHVNADRADA